MDRDNSGAAVTAILKTLKPTKAQTIARRLADDIAAGHFPPGTTLDETEAAARYGVSRTPIREAIRQLTASGMLETRAHRGAVIRAFSEQELDDMFAVMADLEALCARGAARAVTEADLQRLDAILEASAQPAEAGDTQRYATCNDRFHGAVYAAARNAYLVQLTRDTQLRLAPFRRAQFETPGRMLRSLAEHRDIVAALRNRDAGAAFDAMRAHIVVVRGAVDDLTGGRTSLHTS